MQALERREADGAITLESLERAADALGCDLVYALIPRRPLEEMLHDQAQKVAQAQWNAVSTRWPWRTKPSPPTKATSRS